MNRVFEYGIVAAIAASMVLSGCAKEIPLPVVVDPEPERPTQSTEGSIWPGETSRSTLFSDKKAQRIGDIITIHLVEKTTAKNSAKSISSRKQRNSFAANILRADPWEGSISGGTSYRGTGDSSRSEAFYSTISAMITEVLPNGLLRVEGQRQLKINNEDQYIRVAGLVRPEDINFDNSIISTKIANAKITYDGVGDLNRSATGGWGTTLLNYIWPF
jgi:flagellar L-ring protein precursor FlgH